MFTGCFISNACSILEGAIWIHTIIVIRDCCLERCINNWEGMVIDHIHNNTNTCIVISLNHGLQITNNLSWIIWISWKARFWCIIVLWVITPVVGYIPILIVFFVTICDWLQLNIIVAQLLDVIKSSWLTVLVNRSSLSSTQESSSKMFIHTWGRWFGQITNMHFTDNCLTWICQAPSSLRTMLNLEVCNLLFFMAQDSWTFAIRTGCDGIRIACQCLVVRELDLILISFTSQIFLNIQTPDTDCIVLMIIGVAIASLHLKGLPNRSIISSWFINDNLHFCRCRSPESKMSLIVLYTATQFTLVAPMVIKTSTIDSLVKGKRILIFIERTGNSRIFRIINSIITFQNPDLC